MLSTSRATIVIPARISSSRIRNKPLVDFGGQPLVAFVAKQALMVDGAHEVLVVTDHRAVADAVVGICDCVLDDRPAWCGTQRAVYAWQRVPSLFPTRHDMNSIVINWQLDEPLVRPDDVGKLITTVQYGRDQRAITTLACPMPEGALGFSPSVVGARMWSEGAGGKKARGPDSFGRGYVDAFRRGAGKQPGYFRHLGVYGFSATALHELANVPRTQDAARSDLEQLAWMRAGFTVTASVVQCPKLSLRTREDMQAAAEMLGGKRHARIDARRKL